ncbi:MAG: AAA family ATPase [Deltaproteobacteria bacterium]|jgi:ATP-dependent Clp protease ATP-binding subunit ClpB
MSDGVRLQPQVAKPTVAQTEAPVVQQEAPAQSDAMRDVFEQAKATLGDQAQMGTHMKRLSSSPVFETVKRAMERYTPAGQRVQPEHVLLQMAKDQGLKLPDGAEKKLLDAAAQEPGSGFSDSMKLLVVGASLLAGDAGMTTEHLSKAIAGSEGVAGEVLNAALKNEQEERVLTGGTTSVDGEFKKLDSPLVNELTEDLVLLAQEGLLDRISGRDKDIEKVARILSQRQLSSVVLTGDQGVGKTAVPEGLAMMIADGKAPAGFEDTRIMKLQLSRLAKKCNCPGGPSPEDVIAELAAEVAQAARAEPPTQIVFFIDEIGQKLLLDPQAQLLAQQMKESLARGQLKIIGACTTDEYRQSVRQDPALANRLQAHELQEPTPRQAVQMLLTNMEKFASYHGVTYDAGAAQAAVDMAIGVGQREDFRLPRGALYWMDAAGAAVKLSLKGDPPKVRVLRRQIDDAKTARREAVGDSDGAERVRDVLTKQIDAMVEQLTALLPEVDKERKLRSDLITLGEQLATETIADDRDTDRMVDLKKQIDAIHGELEALPEQHFSTVVDAYAIYKTVADDRDIAIDRVVPTKNDEAFEPAKVLGSRVFGQDHAVQEVSRRLVLDRAKLRDPSKPVGAHLFCGPSGVGKTELAKALADEFYNGAFENISCNRLQERHELAILKGAPPGYVGYGETIDLAETIRKLNARGGGVLLLDEIEKAHPDIFPLIMQIMDEGFFLDSKGNQVDCSRIHVVMTSNLGNDIFAKYQDDGKYKNPERMAAEFERVRDGRIPIEVTGRITEIGSIDIFNPTSKAIRKRIVESQIAKIEQFGGDGRALSISASQEAVLQLATIGFHPRLGGRALKAAIAKHVTDQLANEVIAGRVPDGSKVMVDFDGTNFTFEIGKTGAMS